MKLFHASAFALSFSALAQSVGSPAFPASATSPTAQELNTFLSGKSFYTVFADGTRVQSKFGADGGLVSSAPGYTDTGKWRAEEGRLCGSLRKAGEFCNEARFDGGTLYLRRMNGEIIRYAPN